MTSKTKGVFIVAALIAAAVVAINKAHASAPVAVPASLSDAINRVCLSSGPQKQICVESLRSLAVAGSITPAAAENCRQNGDESGTCRVFLKDEADLKKWSDGFEKQP